MSERSPQDEDHETSDAVRGDLHGTPGEWPERQPMTTSGSGTPQAQPARGRQSAQDEDHEAGIEAARVALADYAIADPDYIVRMVIAAYLSRVSPSRVGLVAVEDVEAALVRRLEGPRQPGACVTVNIDGFLAEFSRSFTDRPEQPEPDALGGQPPAEPEEKKDERRP